MEIYLKKEGKLDLKDKMGVYQKYCKNILKQYGKNIKAHEERMDKQTLLELQIPHFLKRGSRVLDSYEALEMNAQKD